MNKTLPTRCWVMWVNGIKKKITVPLNRLVLHRKKKRKRKPQVQDQVRGWHGTAEDFATGYQE